jgi:RimJ/RimL family protein N-acetyltransferase
MPSPSPPGYPHPPIAAPLGDVTTERLTLRRAQDGDLAGLAPVFAKVEVWRYPFGRGFSRDETQAFLESQMAHWEACGFGLWVATERASARTVGYVGLSVPRFLPEVLPAVEVGWRFDPDVWGRGYATEAATAALAEAFTTLQLDEVCSVPQTVNVASVRVAERLGMRLVRPVVIPPDDRRGRVDALLYAIARDDWLARRPT